MSRPTHFRTRLATPLVAAFFVAASVLTPARPVAAQDGTGVSLRTPFGDGTVIMDREQTRKATTVLWGSYTSCQGRFREEVDYLLDLRRRYADRGVGIAVIMPPEAAAELAAEKPDLFVVALDDENAVGSKPTLTAGLTGGLRANLDQLDGAVDVLEQLLSNSYDAAITGQAEQFLQNLMANVADGGEFDPQVAQCLKVLPHSGAAHACAVLNEWWCNGDLDAARRAVRRAIETLRDENLPMVRFADLVLRGDRNDPQLATEILLGLEPAAGSIKAPRTQLTYLRALLLAGQDRRAGRVAATLPKKIEGRWTLQLFFAETLMEAATPMVFRDAAERAIAKAEKNAGNRQWVYGARHKILKRCGDDDAADELIKKYRAGGGGNGSLNNDAWYLMVRPDTLGRFDTLALAQCEEMLRVDGVNVDFNSKDTAALAMFLNGHVERAAKMQTEVKQAGGTGSTYTARLRRYEETKAMLDARKAKDDKRKSGK